MRNKQDELDSVRKTRHQHEVVSDGMSRQTVSARVAHCASAALISQTDSVVE